MKHKAATCFAWVVCFLMLGVPLFAHHGNSAYDEQNPIFITGTVTEFVWANPHCQVYLDVKNGKGKVVHWSVELSSPGVLAKDGFHKTSLKPGDEVTVHVSAAKNGNPVGFAAARVKFADGREVGTSTGNF